MTGSRSEGSLELVTQRELHYAGVGEKAGVVAERARVGKRQGSRSHIEPVQVQCVENLPLETNTLRLTHFPHFAQAQIQTGETVATQYVALSALAREIRAESTDPVRP